MIQLRPQVWPIMQAALQAVDPERAVSHYFTQHPDILTPLQQTQGRLFVIGAGKASAPMAKAVQQLLADKISAGIIIVKYGYSQPLPTGSPIKIIEAGHPVPDDAGLQATRELVALLQQTTAADTVLCLISGGGSALLTLPAEGLTLADLQATNQVLLAVGATINQINTIRKHVSAVKGGRLAELAMPASVISLILSDVVGDPLEVIASGPTVADPTTFAEAETIINQFNLAAKLPRAIIQHLQAGSLGQHAETPKPHDPIFQQVTNFIIGSNRVAAQAAMSAAQTAGWQAQLLTTFIEGEAREVGRVMAALAKGLQRGEGNLPLPMCLVLGGETTVTLHEPHGHGGRNQEMALAAAIALEGWPRILIACLGTDGNDGPTDAAGAWADGETVGRARALGLEAVAHLNHHEAYNLFKALDDLIMTGPTHTNVNDLILIFVW